jgi:hypothetical protein
MKPRGVSSLGSCFLRMIAKPNKFRKLVTYSRIGTSDHHGQRGARDATGRRHLWTAALDPHQTMHRPRPGSRRRRSRVQFRDPWPGGDSPRRPPSRPAAPWPEVARVARMRTPTLVPTDNGGASAREAGSVVSNAVMDSTAVVTTAKTACTAGSAWASLRTTTSWSPCSGTRSGSRRLISRSPLIVNGTPNVAEPSGE